MQCWNEKKHTLSSSTFSRGISIFILQQYSTLCTRNKSSNQSFRRLPSSLTCLLLLLKTSDMRTSFYFLFLTSLPNFLSSNGSGVERATQLISCVKKIRGPLVSHPLFFFGTHPNLHLPSANPSVRPTDRMLDAANRMKQRRTYLCFLFKLSFPLITLFAGLYDAFAYTVQLPLPFLFL